MQSANVLLPLLFAAGLPSCVTTGKPGSAATDPIDRQQAVADAWRALPIADLVGTDEDRGRYPR